MFLLHSVPQREKKLSNRLSDLMNPLSWISCFHCLLQNSALLSQPSKASLIRLLCLQTVLGLGATEKITMEIPIVYQPGAQYQQ